MATQSTQSSPVHGDAGADEVEVPVEAEGADHTQAAGAEGAVDIIAKRGSAKKAKAREDAVLATLVGNKESNVDINTKLISMLNKPVTERSRYIDWCNQIMTDMHPNLWRRFQDDMSPLMRRYMLLDDAEKLRNPLVAEKRVEQPVPTRSSHSQGAAFPQGSDCDTPSTSRQQQPERRPLGREPHYHHQLNWPNRQPVQQPELRQPDYVQQPMRPSTTTTMSSTFTTLDTPQPSLNTPQPSAPLLDLGFGFTSQLQGDYIPSPADFPDVDGNYPPGNNTNHPQDDRY